MHVVWFFFINLYKSVVKNWNVKEVLEGSVVINECIFTRVRHGGQLNISAASNTSCHRSNLGWKSWPQDYKYLSCVPGLDGRIHAEGVVQHRRWRGVPNENPARFIHFYSESILLWFISQKYVNLLQIIIKDIENEKVRCVFQNSYCW